MHPTVVGAATPTTGAAANGRGAGTIGAMDPRLSARLLVVLSICYGSVVAVLGALGSSATGIFALVGALIVGGLWAVRGMFGRG